MWPSSICLGMPYCLLVLPPARTSCWAVGALCPAFLCFCLMPPSSCGAVAVALWIAVGTCMPNDLFLCSCNSGSLPCYLSWGYLLPMPLWWYSCCFRFHPYLCWHPSQQMFPLYPSPFLVQRVLSLHGLIVGWTQLWCHWGWLWSLKGILNFGTW